MPIFKLQRREADLKLTRERTAELAQHIAVTHGTASPATSLV